MRPPTRRSLLPLALFLLPLPLPACADASSHPTTQALYTRAVARLNAGREFESAIADLTQAVKQDPNSSDCHLALGCAEMDRAGSLAYAAWMTDYYQQAQAQYPKDLAKWQSDPQEEPQPVAPQPGLRFPTKDDSLPLTITKTQADAQVAVLERAAQSEWQQAVRLAKTPSARAKAENIQGWGMQYERKILRDTVGSAQTLPSVPEPMAVVAAFQAATKDDPGKAAYWEGLGDAYPYSEFSDRSHAQEIIQAWQRSLTLAPGNVGLGIRLFRVQARTAPDDALKTLRSLAVSAPDNSLVQYSLAALLFKQTHSGDVYEAVIPNAGTLTEAQLAQRREEVSQGLVTQDNATSRQIAAEALAAVERGNRGTEYTIPAEALPIPSLLRPAWDYWQTLEQVSTFGPEFGPLRQLARAVDGDAVILAKQGRPVEAERAARAGIGLGRKMTGSWPVRDTAPLDGSVMQTLVGIAITDLSYGALKRVSTEDAAQGQSAAAESDAFQQKKNAYLAARSQTPDWTPSAYQAYLWSKY